MRKIIHILLVEDDNLDVLNVKRAFDKMNILHKMTVARNGEEAVELLQSNEKEGIDKPDLVLLDINMPKMNGLEFLSTIRLSEQWSDLKVFVITTSDEKIDKEQTARMGISGYIVKPLKLSNPSSMDSFNLMIDLMNNV